MNTIKTLLLLSFSILLFNCSDEEDKKTEKEFIFSASELKQTEWEGEFLYLTNGEIDSKGSIKIVFYTEKKGVCEYKFDATKLHRNHQKCFNDFLDALNDRNVDVVIVANTFTRKWEYVNYADAAKDSGFEVTMLIANGNYQNVHNVPDDVVQKMKNRFEY